MKKNIAIILILLYFILLIVLVGRQIIISTKEIKEHEKNADNIEIILKSELEKAYAEGQKDALNGDIKIKSINFGRYVWIKSPWDDGRKPINDTLIINKNNGNFK